MLAKKIIHITSTNKSLLLHQDVDEVEVIQGEIKRTCYDEKNDWRGKERGWCGTCREGTLPGDYGYCAKNGVQKNEEQEFLVNQTLNWGFCQDSDACNRYQYISYLNVNNCNDLSHSSFHILMDYREMLYVAK